MDDSGVGECVVVDGGQRGRGRGMGAVLTFSCLTS